MLINSQSKKSIFAVLKKKLIYEPCLLIRWREFNVPSSPFGPPGYH